MSTRKPMKRKTTKEREFVAWAIFDGEELACWDYRVPMTWHKWTAINEAKNHMRDAPAVRKVRIIAEE